ncbi:hypothetical protein [Agrobacterium sp. ST15.13.015]|uniref:hypothetical protein n=1 Tax=Agrobacterium sp. ST15.13.015 TaxID=3017319 RepID=UPI0022C1FA44|nr:hypothetical protein [Agrobacterium sp. ST15.13.015]MCZ7502012.1 hypothetical protein [Rhizobium rhizogenes]
MTVYGEPSVHKQGAVIAGNCWAKSPQQVMLLEKILVEAMAQYKGQSEQSLLAKWHQDAVSTLRRSKAEKWPGWEDHYPLAFKPRSGK